MSSRLSTRVCSLLGIEHPVIQTGMGWVSGPGLVSATSNAGGFGFIASATLNFEELRAAIGATKARTDKPFGVNLRADAADIEARIELLAEAGVPVAGFALAPKPELIARLKEHGILVIPSIGAPRHAQKVAGWGADAVLVQGGEGGGHTGSIATSVLLPQVCDSVEIPVIAAGGFFDGRGLAAALCYGAEGIGMGTRFLLTAESPVSDAVKSRYLQSNADATTVTLEVDGVPHRVLRTPLIEQLERTSRLSRLPGTLRNAADLKQRSGQSWPALIREALAMKKTGDLSWSQVVMAANTPSLLRAGLVEGDSDAGVLSSGQVAAAIDDIPTCAALIERIVDEAVATLQRGSSLSSVTH